MDYCIQGQAWKSLEKWAEPVWVWKKYGHFELQKKKKFLKTWEKHGCEKQIGTAESETTMSWSAVSRRCFKIASVARFPWYIYFSACEYWGACCQSLCMKLKSVMGRYFKSSTDLILAWIFFLIWPRINLEKKKVEFVAQSLCK